MDVKGKRGKMYTFVEEKDILFKYELSELEPEKIYEHFMQYDDEVCFILDKGFVYGIVTIGDMCRYYANETENLNITKKYRSISEVDYTAAEVIFNEISTVHEVPVIVNNHLIGIVIKKCSGDNRKGLRKRLEKEHYGEVTWVRNELKGTVYLYDLSTPDIDRKISRSDYDKLTQKHNYPDGTSGLKMMSELEKKVFFGSNYSEDSFNEFCMDYDNITGTIVNGVCKVNDICSRHFNFKNGYRIMRNANSIASRRIWMFGPCMVVGAYVEDACTIACYLQEILKENGWENYCVVNCGLFGPKHMEGRIATEKIADEDIVIIAYNFKELDQFRETKNWKGYSGSLGDAYLELENPIDNLFNAFSHCNHVVNQKISERLFRDIRQSLTKDNNPVSPRIAIQDYYIPWDVVKYYRDYCKEHGLIHLEGTCGAIVMNCNPFTKGHRYLIEQACKQVDVLYVFVVEEDKSVFKFEDRIEMVRRGTVDLEKVRVLPSGKYIISKETFSQYFDKDNVEQVDDMDYDVRIFGAVVAKELGISVRFVGEEPFDKVTKKYNETMKKILPEYDINVIEIPRTTTEEGSVISASAVRKAMQKKDERLLHIMLPDTTIEYLSKHGADGR